MAEQRRYDEACSLFERSQGLDPSPGTLLNLADCQEHRGELLEALSTFEQALVDMQAEQFTEKRKTWSEVAFKRRDTLAVRVPLIVVQSSPTAGAVTSLDGKALRAREVRLEPGEHRIEVTAPNKLPYARRFELKSGQPPLEIVLPALEDPPESRAKVAVVPFVSAPLAPQPPTTPPEPSSRSSSTWPWIFFGTSAALGVSSLVTYAIAASKADDLDQNCNAVNIAGVRGCDSSLADTKSSGESLMTATQVLWVGTALTGITGVIWLIAEGAGDDEPAPSAKVGAGCFGSAGCGLSLAGQF